MNEHQDLKRVFYFIDFFKDIGYRKGKEMEEQDELFFFSCLWKEGRLTGSNLYPAAEGENSGIWTCGCLDLLASPLLLSADHSMDRAICLIS